MHAQELEVHLKVLKADADMAELRRLLAPPPPMAQGAYGDHIRFMAMELMGKANVCATLVPSVIGIVARYYGICIPERVKGKGVDARILPWVPFPSTCLRIRCEMGALSQLQVGEYIIEKGGSAGHLRFIRTAPLSTAPRCRPLCWGNAPPTPPALRRSTISCLR